MYCSLLKKTLNCFLIKIKISYDKNKKAQETNAAELGYILAPNGVNETLQAKGGLKIIDKKGNTYKIYYNSELKSN